MDRLKTILSLKESVAHSAKRAVAFATIRAELHQIEMPQTRATQAWTLICCKAESHDQVATALHKLDERAIERFRLAA